MGIAIIVPDMTFESEGLGRVTRKNPIVTKGDLLSYSGLDQGIIDLKDYAFDDESMVFLKYTKKADASFSNETVFMVCDNTYVGFFVSYSPELRCVNPYHEVVTLEDGKPMAFYLVGSTLYFTQDGENWQNVEISSSAFTKTSIPTFLAKLDSFQIEIFSDHNTDISHFFTA